MQGKSVATDVGIGVLVSLMIAGVGRPATAQDPVYQVASQSLLPGQLAPGGPRFLLSRGNTLVPLDASRTSALKRRLSVSFDGVSVRDALRTIARQAEFELLFSDQIIPERRSVHLEATGISVAAALTDVLLDSGVDIVFTPSGTVTLLKRPEADASPPMPSRRLDGPVSGVVIDSAGGRPLAGAQVAVEGTPQGAITDAQGRFRIERVSGDQVTLRVRMLGYKPITQSVRVGATDIRIALEQTVVGLEGIVVTASGEQRLREVGSSIARVRADSVVQEAPVTNLSELLSARAAGVYIKTASGSSVGGTRIRIRGSSSPSLGNEPIVYVDGIRVNTEPQSLSYANNQQVPSRFNDINPDEIESIDVLKGPSASTMYGTEAANGVILITTKSGRTATRKAEWQGWAEGGRITEPNTYPRNYGGVDAAGKACLLTSIAAGTCTQTELRSFNLLMEPSTTPFRTGSRGVLGASLTGKSGDVNYFLSGEYENEKGVYQPDGVKKTSVRGNFTIHPTDALQFVASTGYVSSNLNLFADGGTALGIVTNALAGGACSTCWFQNSAKQLAQIDARQHIDRFIGSTTAQLQATNWLQFRATAGLDAIGREDQRLFPVGVFPGGRVSGQRDVGRNTALRYTGDLLARFTIPLGEALSSVSSVGGQFLRDRSVLVTATGTQLVPGSNSLSAAGLVTTREQTTEIRSAGAYLEQQLGYHDRLFLTGGFRIDNNSSFGKQFKAIVYPKVGASWVISEEPFFPRSSAISSVRIRTTWGQSGSQPGPLNAVTYYNAFPVTTPDGLNQVGVSFEGGNLGNPKLKPERSSEIEGGVDLGLWKERLNLALTYYDKRTKDALVLRQVAPSVGASTGRWENLAEVQNTGWEGSLTLGVYESKAAKLGLVATGTYNKNKLLTLGAGVAPITLGTNQRHVQGYPLGGYWMRTITSYQDRNNDRIISASEVTVTDTAQYLGEVVPPFMASIQPSLSLFSRVRVGAVFALSYGNKLYNFTEGFRCNGGGARGRNDITTPLSEQARCVAHALLGVPGGFVEDAGFTKLRELSLTFYLPTAWARAARLRGGSITLAGQNLATWTDYPGIDPDISSRGTNFETVDFLQPGGRRMWVIRVNTNF